MAAARHPLSVRPAPPGPVLDSNGCAYAGEPVDDILAGLCTALDRIDLSAQPNSVGLPDLAARRYIVTGEPAACINMLADGEALRADPFITFQERGRLPQLHVMTSMRLLGEEIVPYFQAAAARQAAAAD